jgi:hypothetical protein
MSAAAKMVSCEPGVFPSLSCGSIDVGAAFDGIPVSRCFRHMGAAFQIACNFVNLILSDHVSYFPSFLEPSKLQYPTLHSFAPSGMPSCVTLMSLKPDQAQKQKETVGSKAD